MAKKHRAAEGNGHAPSIAPTRQVKVLSVTFTASAPYAEGHVCSVDEAATLNQVRAENLRNNFSKHVKAWQEAGSDEAGLEKLRSDFAAYDAAYVFRGPRVSVVVDPVEKLARTLAREAIKAKLRERGRDSKEFSDEWWQERISQVLAGNPTYREEANRRHSATQAMAAEAISDLGLE